MLSMGGSVDSWEEDGIWGIGEEAEIELSNL